MTKNKYISTILKSSIKNPIAKEHEMWKIKYNVTHINISYCVGDIVYLKRALEYTIELTQLQPKYRRLLVITQVLSENTYRFEELLHHKGHQYRMLKILS